MDNMFLGRPSTSIEAWIKGHRPTPAFEGDIYVLDDGTEVKVSKDDLLAQGAVNIFSLPDGLANNSISMYKYGVGHDDIDNLFYYDKQHGIDLSKTKIESLDRLDLAYNQLTAFSLPDSLESFYYLNLDSNQLTAFSLPDSLTSLTELYLNNNQLTAFLLPDSLAIFSYLRLYDNQLTAFSLPASLADFSYLGLDNTCNLDCTACTAIPTIGTGIYNQNDSIWQGTVLVRDAAQKEAFEADEKWKQYKIEVK